LFHVTHAHEFLTLVLACGLAALSALSIPHPLRAQDADSLRAVQAPDTAATVVGDTLGREELLEGDSLEQVQRDAAAARERIQEARKALEGFPAEDRLRRSPTGAVIRAFALPGWGQLYTGHKFRALMYGGAEVGFATLGFIEHGKVSDFKDQISSARLNFIAQEQAAHPDSVFSRADTLALLARFDASTEGRALELELDSKRKQREDYFTYAIFSVIFAAIDAFVSAHLEPFQESDLTFSLSRDGGEVGLRLPLGPRPPPEMLAPDR
jgi:hypothetical protein